MAALRKTSSCQFYPFGSFRVIKSELQKLWLQDRYVLSKQIHTGNFATRWTEFIATKYHSYFFRPVNGGETEISRRCICTSSKLSEQREKSELSLKERLSRGPPFEHFINNNTIPHTDIINDCSVPYLKQSSFVTHGRKVYFETYGCQMNMSDTDIAWSILQQHGYERTDTLMEADVVLLMTCAIREGAESKIWKRLHHLKAIKKRRNGQKYSSPMKIGILGCMAERLKSEIIEREEMVDLVCGPDAYKDLPRMVCATSSGQTAVNVQLSLEETYADILPVRRNDHSPSAFVSIMRGCDNMCSYCIVPFTRGRERSRPLTSILDEVRALSDQGTKEVTLLGQNVNSYRDLSEVSYHGSTLTELSAGFKTIYKSKKGGQRFGELLDKVSLIDPEMRIRFTSPHPKDFPDQVLELIKQRPNICKQIHIPAQSGNNGVLSAMRRGYSREAYLDLIYHIRHIIPDVSLSSDFIAGFCGETEEAHRDTMSLMRVVQYDYAFCFPFSMRQKTHAAHRLTDDVPEMVKSRRHMELVQVFREGAAHAHQALIGRQQLVLIEGESKRSCQDLAGRNEANTRLILPNVDVPTHRSSHSHRPLQPGDYVVVQITAANSQTLKGVPLYQTTLLEFSAQQKCPISDNIDCMSLYGESLRGQHR